MHLDYGVDENSGEYFVEQKDAGRIAEGLTFEQARLFAAPARLLEAAQWAQEWFRDYPETPTKAATEKAFLDAAIEQATGDF